MLSVRRAGWGRVYPGWWVYRVGIQAGYCQGPTHGISVYIWVPGRCPDGVPGGVPGGVPDGVPDGVYPMLNMVLDMGPGNTSFGQYLPVRLNSA